MGISSNFILQNCVDNKQDWGNKIRSKTGILIWVNGGIFWKSPPWWKCHNLQKTVVFIPKYPVFRSQIYQNIPLFIEDFVHEWDTNNPQKLVEMSKFDLFGCHIPISVYHAWKTFIFIFNKKNNSNTNNIPINPIILLNIGTTMGGQTSFVWAFKLKTLWSTSRSWGDNASHKGGQGRLVDLEIDLSLKNDSYTTYTNFTVYYICIVHYIYHLCITCMSAMFVLVMYILGPVTPLLNDWNVPKHWLCDPLDIATNSVEYAHPLGGLKASLWNPNVSCVICAPWNMANARILHISIYSHDISPWKTLIMEIHVFHLYKIWN
jgi:hypothetical protein